MLYIHHLIAEFFITHWFSFFLTTQVDGIAEDLNWEVFRQTLIEQAEQGVDCKSLT